MSVKQKMADLKVAVSSPDNSVQVRLDRQKGVRTRIASTAADHHSESSLARQVELALAAAMDDYRDKVDKILADTSTSGKPPEADTPFGKRLALIDQVMEQVYVKTQSQARYLTLEWKGERSFTIAFDRGVLHEIGPERLAEEVNSALANANRERAQRIMHARRTALKAANELR